MGANADLAVIACGAHTPLVDERAADLDRRVAEAADAWLADPRDVGVYGRLVAAIEARRVYLQPGLFTPSTTPSPTADKAAEGAAVQQTSSPGGSSPEVDRPSLDDLERPQNEELLDELGAGSVQPLGEQLAGGDVRAILHRLRSGE